MGTYATNADIAKRIGRSLTASTKPSTTDVDAWISEAEGEIEAELIAAELTVPVTDSRGVLLLKSKVTSYATARWIEAIAAASNLAVDRTDAPDLMREFTDFRDVVRGNPSRAATMLGQAPGTVGGATAVRGYQTDNSDGASIAAGDFDPTFTKKGKNW